MFYNKYTRYRTQYNIESYLQINNLVKLDFDKLNIAGVISLQKSNDYNKATELNVDCYPYSL